jgi:NTP pyrophosphatase (non-canonical NTP hydrolase)
MTISELVTRAHDNAVKHGFWDPAPAFGTAIALIHSELSEALEEVRSGKPELYFKEVNGFTVTDATERRGEKPEGVAVELADAVIRIADLCGHLGIDLEAAIDLKMAYNETRPFKHGKRF